MLRKNLLYLVCVVSVGLLGWVTLWDPPRFLKSFVPPGAAERRAAVGSTSGVTPILQVAFNPEDESFSPIPTPQPSDWLATISETGQTFAQYQRSQPNRPDQTRTTIYLLPLGEFPADVAPSLSRLADFASAFFEMPVKQLPEVSIQGLPIKSRPRASGRQLLAGDVLKWMKPRVPKDAYCVLAVTMTDLYPEPKWNFVFGQGSFKDRVGVHSFARYLSRDSGVDATLSAERLLLLRSCKILAHETGHMFGIKHCVHYQCLMNGTGGLSETDAVPIHFCPVCLRKLHFAKPFEVEQRYRNLKALSNQFGWESEEKWLSARISCLAPAVE
jgi:archaemetzincin